MNLALNASSIADAFAFSRASARARASLPRSRARPTFDRSSRARLVTRALDVTRAFARAIARECECANAARAFGSSLVNESLDTSFVRARVWALRSLSRHSSTSPSHGRRRRRRERASSEDGATVWASDDARALSDGTEGTLEHSRARALAIEVERAFGGRRSKVEG